ncbi:MAG TPA: TolC family protein [Blastocatellia bacterium]|jgi:outer membrane protein TolC|nr:TolC family protein [Blastocatellia bacterium]
MFISSRPLHALFSGAFIALFLASNVAAQDKPTGASGPSDATALPILNLNLLTRPTPEKTSVTQDGLFDFTPPRMMKPMGLIPPSDRGADAMAQAGAGSASGALRLTLDEALARAVATNALVAASAGVSAAHFHHKALQSDYFPKVGAFLVNIHYNKFMGDTIQLFRRGIIFPTLSRAVPLFDKDQTFVGPTVTQPLTPLFKVHEAVRIAKADERIAEAKADAVSVQLVADVERAYFDLLIAQRRQAEAMANVEIAERKMQIASADAASVDGVMERETALLVAKKALLVASDRVTELTNCLSGLTGLPEDARLELVPPPPAVIEADFYSQQQQKPPQAAPPQKPRPVIAYNPEIVEAEETVVKAKAAHRLAKLEYVPDAVITGGYMFQTGIPALPDDFSWIGVVATWTIFDFFKRERTIKERGAQVTMAKANLEMVRAKVAAESLKTVMDVDRTRRILELTRRVASMQRAMTSRDQDPGPEAKAALAKAEAEMFQAELDYRMAYSQLKRASSEQ